jgi:hypothetical protein
MKKLIFILAVIPMLSFSQKDMVPDYRVDSLVDFFDSKRNIVKLRVNPKQVDSILKTYTQKTYFLEKKINGKWIECKGRIVSTEPKIQDEFKLKL